MAGVSSAKLLDPNSINFRPLKMADLPLMHRWLNAGEVRQWYALKDYSFDDVVAEYEPVITGEEPMQSFLIRYGDQPIGYTQTYLIRDDPEYAAALQVEAGAAGVDLFIGDDAYRHRGLGAPLLRQFLREIIFANDAVTSCVLGPDPANTGAIRTYERVGFRYLKTVPVPDQAAPEYLMGISRAAALGAPVRRPDDQPE